MVKNLLNRVEGNIHTCSFEVYLTMFCDPNLQPLWEFGKIGKYSLD